MKKLFFSYFILFFMTTSWAESLPEVIKKYQWGLSNTGAPQMADLNPVKGHSLKALKHVDIQVPAFLKKTKPVIVAVLDTGMDKDHPWLKNRLHKKEKSCPAYEEYLACVQSQKENCVKKMEDVNADPEGDGYALDCSGWSMVMGYKNSAVRGRPDFSDDSGHGTHVAGVVAQVSPNAQILPVQVLPTQPNAPIKAQSVDFPYSSKEKDLPLGMTLGDFVTRGVIYAVKSGAQVINFSAGWNPGADSKFLREVIAEAQKRGVIFVMAAGNDSTQALLRPCTYPGVICVGSHNPDGSVSHFSNYGPHVDILAPGLNIFSAYPMHMMANFFNEELGYNFYSGTSQAVPFVSGAIAEMLAAGIPATEIYPRLLLSAKKTLPFLGIFEGLPHESLQAVESQYKDTKTVLSGRLQLADALKVAAQPLILTTSKEAQSIKWDRQAAILPLSFELKNYWQAVDLSQVKIVPELRNPLYRNRASFSNLSCDFGGLKQWTAEQTFTCQTNLNIVGLVDSTQLASEIDVFINIYINGNKQRITSAASYEIFVPISKEMKGSGVESVPFITQMMSGSRLIPIDENFSLNDKNLEREYFSLKKTAEDWQIALAKFENGKYFLTPYLTLPERPRDQTVDDEDDETNERDIFRDHFFVKADLNFDGKDEYLLGIIKWVFDHPTVMTTFYIFDTEFASFQRVDFDGKVSVLPFEVSWMRVEGTNKKASLRPAWVAPGYETKALTSREIWKNKITKDDLYKGQTPEIRFYYFDEKFSVRSIKEVNGYRVVDLLQQNRDEKARGETPVLLAKNKGTDLHPNYFYDFAVAILKNGQVMSFQKLDWADFGLNYTNLLDTRVDKVLNLATNENEFVGSYWFGNSFNGQQKMVQLVRNEKGGFEFKDLLIERSAYPFDFPSLIRAAYYGYDNARSFTLTNSEILYSAQKLNREVLTSQNRFTFLGESATGNLLFPITVQQKNRPTHKLPALYEAQVQGLTTGVKILAPVFAYDDKPETILGIVAPARLRFLADRKQGCLPIETPYFNKAHYLEFYCKDQILRLKLEL